LWHQSDYSSPLVYFRRALELDPMFLPRYADLGTLHGWRGESEETKAIALEVASRFDTLEAFELIANLYELAGELDEAIALAWKGRQVSSPEIPDATWQLSDLYARIGDFETASTLTPELGLSQYYWRREYQPLIDIAEEVIIDRPDELTTYFELAFAYNTVGDHAAAARLLRLAGLPEVVYSDSRRSVPLRGMATFADALRLHGKVEESREVATWLFNHMTKGLESQGRTWWTRIYRACAAMNLNRQAEALQDLESLAKSPALVWEPVLRDSRCFASLSKDPVYQKVLAGVEARKAGYRARLPTVLAKHDMTDYVAQAFRDELRQP
jgi:tetratricopeptide (TPR) repeat protein